LRLSRESSRTPCWPRSRLLQANLPGTQGRHQQEAATAAIGQPLAEVVREIEMRECVQSQHAVEAFAVALEHVLEETQRSSCIGDNQTDVEVGGGLLERFQKPLVRQVEANNPVFDPEFVRKVLTTVSSASSRAAATLGQNRFAGGA